MGSFPWVDRRETHKERIFGGISFEGEGDAIEDTLREGYLQWRRRLRLAREERKS
jgi:hypothetical protein